MHNIKAILFDLDGTLTDPAEGIVNSIRYALEKMEHPCPSVEVLHSHIGPPLQLAFGSIFSDNHPSKVQTAVDHYRHRYSREGKGIIENKLYPSIPEVLAKLQQRGKKLFIATSKPTPITRQITAHFGLDVFFDEIYGSELDGTRSNKGDLIGYILEREKLDSDQTVMIGDRMHDIVGASKHNVRGIGALWGYGSEDELRNAGSVESVKEPIELVGLLT